MSPRGVLHHHPEAALPSAEVKVGRGQDGVRGRPPGRAGRVDGQPAVDPRQDQGLRRGERLRAGKTLRLILFCF